MLAGRPLSPNGRAQIPVLFRVFRCTERSDTWARKPRTNPFQPESASMWGMNVFLNTSGPLHPCQSKVPLPAVLRVFTSAR